MRKRCVSIGVRVHVNIRGRRTLQVGAREKFGAAYYGLIDSVEISGARLTARRYSSRISANACLAGTISHGIELADPFAVQREGNRLSSAEGGA